MRDSDEARIMRKLKKAFENDKSHTEGLAN